MKTHRSQRRGDDGGRAILNESITLLLGDSLSNGNDYEDHSAEDAELMLLPDEPKKCVDDDTGFEDQSTLLGNVTDHASFDPEVVGHDDETTGWSEGAPIEPGIVAEPFATAKAPHGSPIVCGIGDEMLSLWTQREATNPELNVILVHLLAVQAIHRSAHWLCRGDAFFGNHKMFEELYASTVEEIDRVGEKIMGLSDTLTNSSLRCEVDPGVIQQDAVKVHLSLSMGVTTFTSSSSLVNLSLAAEKCFLECCTAMLESMQHRGAVSRGVDNLIAGIMDVHEGHVYLLSSTVAPASGGLAAMCRF